MDYANTKGTAYTPQQSFADLTSLNTLPKVALIVHKTHEAKGSSGAVRVTLENPSKSVAFMVHLRLANAKGGDDVTPVFWDDNYFSLVPGEKKAVTARYELSSLEGKQPELEVGGWNIASSPVAAAAK
jgi:exo-1,4-beta-D-glucosaminidase